MDADLVAPLYTALSAERLAPYVVRANGDKERALRLYCWNTEVSAALNAPLSWLEVVLRNAVHDELSRFTGRMDWWNAGIISFDNNDRKRLTRARNRVGNGRPGAIVAEMSFRFWVNLLHGRNEDLWRRSVRRAFPGHQGPRRELYRNLDHLVKLRNRIAHHEPIHHRDLRMDHKNAIVALECICPRTAAYVRANDRTPTILTRKDAVVNGDHPTGF